MQFCKKSLSSCFFLHGKLIAYPENGGLSAVIIFLSKFAGDSILLLKPIMGFNSN